MASKSTPRAAHKGEVDLNWVMKYLKDGVYPYGLNFSEKRMVRKRAERFCFLNGDLYYLGSPTDQELGKKTRKVLLTHEDRWKKVEELHVGPDGCHQGLEKTADAITSDYHWVGIYKFIKDFIRQCATCRERHPTMRVVVQQGVSPLQDGGMMYGSNVDAGMVDDAESAIGDEDGIMPEKGLFWEKVDMRLFGPFKVETVNKYILGFLDCHTKWSEAFLLHGVSPVTVSHTLLLVMSRYGLMRGLLMSRDDEILEDALVRGLELLDTEADIQIPFLMEEKDPSADSLFKELEYVLEKFVKKYPNNWHESLEFCLLPFRSSRLRKSAYSPAFMTNYREAKLPASVTHKKGTKTSLHLTTGEKMKSTDTLMSLQMALSGEPTSSPTRPRKSENVFTSPQQTVVSEAVPSPAPNVVYVTRSRTGNTKPKSMDEENFEISTPKRKSANSTGETSARKRVKVESIATVSPSTMKEDLSETESEDFTPEAKDKKAMSTIDLDSYYKAIGQYVQGNGYPENSTNSFKRLIRDQAKNYSYKDGELYHEVGNKGTWKKIIATKDERVKLLTEMYQKTSSKTQMFAELEPFHWKGKLVDCEAFIMASPIGEKSEQKTNKDTSFKHLSEAKKLLKYDTIDTYNEIKNYLIYDVFSNDDIATILDEIKRQLKFFKVENDELSYVIGNKKRRVLTSSTEREKAIQEAHVKKGTHADLNVTFNHLSETAFWFGMKLDVKTFINCCCLTTQDNKHLIDRYFIFREHFMKNYVPKALESEEVEEITTEEVPTESVIESVEEESLVISTDVSTEVEKPSPQKQKPSGIFESSIHQPTRDLEKAMPNLAATLAAVETSLAAKAGTSVITTDSIRDDIQAETDDAFMVQYTEMEPTDKENAAMGISEETVITEETVTSAETTVATTEASHEPGAITVKLAEDGVTVLVSKSVGDKPSDNVTLEAVQSILPKSGAMFTTVSESQTTSEVNSQSTSASLTGPDASQSETDMDGNMGDLPLDEITEEGEDSDEMLYDTDEEEEEEDYYDRDFSNTDRLNEGGEGSKSGTPDGGQKKPSTPRQHFKCNQCDKIFFGPLKFKMHMYKHTGNKPFPCNQCNKKYTTKKSLVIHQRTHIGDLPYVCTLCGKRTPSKIALKSHLKCHDKKGGGFPASCDVCGRHFTRRHLMERHKLHKHTNAQNGDYKCADCDKRFGHQRSLKRHYMAAHMGVKNHKCTLCGKTFYRKEYLTGHLLQHGGTAAEGITKRVRQSTFKPRPSVFAQSYQEKGEKEENVVMDSEQVQRIILHQDENGQLRVVDLETEREVKRMLDAQINRGEVGETMVVHIEEPNGGQPQLVHVEHSDEQVVEVPIEGQNEVEYQLIQDDSNQQEYVISSEQGASSNTQYIYATSGGEIIQGNQDLVYGQPAVQYEVECVGDVDDEEALSAINLLAQASAQQYETVISQI